MKGSLASNPKVLNTMHNKPSRLIALILKFYNDVKGKQVKLLETWMEFENL